jgi:hypothetical protein
MGLVVIGKIETMIPNTNSSIVKSSFFPKIIEIIEMIFWEVSGK